MLIRDINIKIDMDKCIACGICVDRCIMDNLRLSVAPCRQTCPLHLNCQGYVSLIANNEIKSAFKTMESALPFIGILSKVCHAPCEKACVRSKVDAAIPIRGLKQFITDNDSSYLELASTNNQEQTGKKAAIVGCGPAGLMAAWQLCKKGHNVRLFDTRDQLEGQCMTTCHPLDISRQEAKKIINTIADSGVTFEVLPDKKSLDFETVSKSYDTVIITTTSYIDYSWLPEDCITDDGNFIINSKSRQFITRDSFFLAKEIKVEKPLLINALASGKKAADSANQFLLGMPVEWGQGFGEASGNIKEYTPPFHRAKNKSTGEEKNSIIQNIENQKKNRSVFTSKEAVSHAKRCLGCGRPFDANSTCWYCLPCEIECPYQALEVKIPYMIR